MHDDALLRLVEQALHKVFGFLEVRHAQALLAFLVSGNLGLPCLLRLFSFLALGVLALLDLLGLRVPFPPRGLECVGVVVEVLKVRLFA